MSEQNHELKRGLKARHLNMIALGGSIGTGIFLAMGDTLHQAGPGGALVAYGLIGIMVYFLITSLGEMATFMPISGSFSSYATKFIDPALGFALGWNYWYNWAITIAAEMVAGSLIMKYWFPSIPGFYWSILFLIIIVGLNFLSAKAYGESEYWFAGIKVVTVIIFLAIGVLMIFGIMGSDDIGFHNYFIGDGPFHGGIKSIFAIFLVAGFSFQGTELIGVAAGESEHPEKTIPKAIKSIFWRILIFYLGTIIVLGAIIPFTKAGVSESPFTMVFAKAGIAGAASLMNAVILTSVLSAGNSGMYASTRMLHSMATEGLAPKIFARTNKRGVPVNALILTTIVASACFLTGVFAESTVYVWLVAASGLAGFIAWVGIAICHYRFRKAYIHQGYSLSELKFKAKWYPFGPILALLMCFVIILGQGYSCITEHGVDWHSLIASYIGIPLFFALYIGYKIKHKTKVISLDDVDLTYNDDCTNDLKVVEKSISELN
ncbi:amino acid permease [Paraclostridium sordellii]|uniref:amino acid permease n=1 Tax=Paraclostridium sordellii TaxID=1505 RepID=UPI00038694FA|nr:amino acid permease [Paeniclostridium sordellii]EPZ55036.1 amino acid permease family protein [[Clostridium] sordellii VPI 9048] [Paeniclostridium sordellii VPI 9048]CEK36940.1 amino-acid permease [[Clostridium] sordellii] [Paeniclostridium sordellii]CEN85478.1 lysine-specific permease LysP [[Clostridium] sordellii] [Paeniclostridium sordellii]CEO14922.1 lysine-specific permease LysP [[Clostridium] sordellii] [Paeniclostridium sordellii]CEP45081.1 lysine-specific permease LysP [[Clostridium